MEVEVERRPPPVTRIRDETARIVTASVELVLRTGGTLPPLLKIMKNRVFLTFKLRFDVRIDLARSLSLRDRDRKGRIRFPTPRTRLPLTDIAPEASKIMQVKGVISL